MLKCETRRNQKRRNSLVKAVYGGWLLYTVASTGDVDFVCEFFKKTLKKERRKY